MKKYPTYTIELYQGSTETLPIAFYSVNGEIKTPTILSNDAEIVFAIKDELGTDDLFTLTKSEGLIEIGAIVENTFIPDTTGLGNNNAIRITFPSSMTKDFIVPEMLYDLMIIHDDDTKELLLHGVILTYNGVTDART